MKMAKTASVNSPELKASVVRADQESSSVVNASVVNNSGVNPPDYAAVLAAESAPVPAAWANELARTQFGLKGTIDLLTGERDSNFLISAGDRRYMLKVSHPAESPEVADFQTQALLHLERHAPALPVQRVIPNLAGQPAFNVSAPDGQMRVVRLIVFLPGQPMPQTPRSASQRRSVARMLAQLDLALASLSHPTGARALPWDLQRADDMRVLLAHIPPGNDSALAASAFDDFTTYAKPVLKDLRRQPIHNDFNLYNLLVEPDDADSIAGILDFGDMVEAPMVNDLAVAASYQIDAEHDPLSTIAEFVGAYHAVLPLQEQELDILFTLIRARLAMVVAISGWRAARQPENANYLLRNNPVSWARLSACANIDPAQAREALRLACPHSIG